MRASIIMPVCNQGEWLRKTIESAIHSLSDAWFDYEFVVVDDGSTDGCCDGVETDRVILLKNANPVGATHARHQAMLKAQGDVFLMCDPHCSFPKGALSRLVTLANDTGRLTMPKVRMYSEKVLAGGGMCVSYRGLQLTRPSRPRPRPSCMGTIYAFNRTIYRRLLEFPRLPGKWGYQEQAMSVLLYKTGMRASVDTKYTCNHIGYRRKGTYPFDIPKGDIARNAFYFHALCLPQTYLAHWHPILVKHFGKVKDWSDGLFKSQSQGLCQLSEKSDDEVLTDLCGENWRTQMRRKRIAS